VNPNGAIFFKNLFPVCHDLLDSKKPEQVDP
jgi:hypothetical protein